MNNKPVAFVIMPFEDDLKPVYDEFIKPILSESGYEVKRADDIESQQNILRDIVESIYSSDLIVADLTDTNPNVFYELGLAHAFKRQVILITQSVDEVPFDLRSQRLLEYDLRFDKMNEAKDTLGKYARGALDGSVKFGSPVTDSNLGESSGDKEAHSSAHINRDEDEPGLLDHLVAINEGYSRIGEIAVGVGGDFEELTKSTSLASEDFVQIKANPSDTSTAAARNTARKLAKQVGNFTTKLNKANSEYSGIARDTENSLESVVTFQREHSEESGQDIDEQLETLQSLRTVVTDSRETLLILAADMDRLPRLERRLNRELTRASEEIRMMAGNLERTIASISRALRDQA